MLHLVLEIRDCKRAEPNSNGTKLLLQLGWENKLNREPSGVVL